METIKQRLSSVDWQRVTRDMHRNGYSVINEILDNAICDQLIKDYEKKELYRKTITMERYRFGYGEYKYFNYPLPGVLQTIRETVYPFLAPIANEWMRVLRTDISYPPRFKDMQVICHNKQQVYPTVLILKYGAGGHNTLHQDIYGDVFFPIQLVLFLNQPDNEYEGGEFVLTQQTPRAQSKAIVLKPCKGDMLLFTTNFRPVKGSKGYYRANMKHGVSEVHSGTRHTLGIIFHDALT